MRRNCRRASVVTLGTASLSALTLMFPTGLATAAPEAAGASSSRSGWTTLPSYATWVSDVTAATRKTGAHLDDRLPDPSKKTAIVLDIDNTALESTYAKNSSPIPATDPVLAVAKQAKKDGAAVFFVTARGESLRSSTTRNLQAAGYPIDGLYLRPSGTSDSLQTYKTRQRIKIEGQGYTIVANIGNNTTDINGGHAEHTTKLPDYNGLLP
jgi:predicted secreted acid phosphatase